MSSSTRLTTAALLSAVLSAWCQITIEIPDEALVALRVAPEHAGAEVRLAAAAKLYELGRLSSGSAAKLAGIPRVAFLAKLADYGIDTFLLTKEQLAQEAPLG